MKNRSLVVLVVATSTVLLIWLVPDDTQYPFLFLFRAAYLQISVVISVVILCYAGFFVRTGGRAAVCVVALVALNAPNIVALGSGPDKKNERSTTLTVLTFSTLTRTANLDDIRGSLFKVRPDIACLQEVSDPSALADSLSYHSVSSGGLLIGALEPAREISRGPGWQAVEVIPEGEQPITVINVHLGRIYTDSGRERWLAFLHMIREATFQRMILCGDFNLTPYNSAYWQLLSEQNLTDAHRAAGSGLGLTFPSDARRLAMLGLQIRIDYILTRGFRHYRTETVVGSDRSDHLAVVAHISRGQE